MTLWGISLAQPEPKETSPAASTSSLTPLRSSSSSPRLPSPPPLNSSLHHDDPHIITGPFAPYTDDPESGFPNPNPTNSHLDSTSHEGLIFAQRQLMDEQDVHLDRLSHSINRQRDLSLQINDELDVHTGLLEGLDTDLDGTGDRMRAARRRLDRVAKGAKENSACFLFVTCYLREASETGDDTNAYFRRFDSNNRTNHPSPSHLDYHLQDIISPDLRLRFLVISLFRLVIPILFLPHSAYYLQSLSLCHLHLVIPRLYAPPSPKYSFHIAKNSPSSAKLSSAIRF